MERPLRLVKGLFIQEDRMGLEQACKSFSGGAEIKVR